MGRTQLILLDTHIVIWALSNPAKLSRRALTVIQKSNGSSLALSCASLYEVGRLIARNRIAVSHALEEFLGILEAQFVVIPLGVRVAAVSARLPAAFHSDPFDRIITATALVEGVPLITADERIRKSGVVQTIW